VRRGHRSVTIGAGLVLIALLAEPVLAALTWGPVVRLTSGDVYHIKDEGLAVDGSTVHVLYHHFDREYTGAFYRRSLDSGATWGRPVGVQVLSNEGITQYRISSSSIAARNGVVIAVTARVLEDSEGVTYCTTHYIRSADGGTRWGRPVAIPGSECGGSVAMTGTTVLIADATDVGAIVARRSTDGGVTFGPPQELSPEGAGIVTAAAGPYMYVAWSPAVANATGTSLFLRRSIDRGASFEPAVTITEDDVRYVSLSASGSVVLAHYETGAGLERVSRSSDAGQTFASRTVAGTATSYTYEPGDVFISGQRARLVYTRSARDGGARARLLRTSVDAGATWSTPQLVNQDTGYPRPFTNVVAGSGFTVVAWDTKAGNVFARRGQ
jgi:hypothetical protein